MAQIVITEYKALQQKGQNPEQILEMNWWNKTRFLRFGTEMAKVFKKKPEGPEIMEKLRFKFAD